MKSTLITLALAFTTGCMEVQHGWDLPGGDTASDTDTAVDTGSEDTGDTGSDTGDTDSGGDTSTDSDDSGDTAVDTGPTAQELCEELRGCSGDKTVATWCESDWSVGTTTCASDEECQLDSYGNGTCVEVLVAGPVDRDVCYMPDEEVFYGQMYLDGIHFSYWDSSPAAYMSSDSGDLDGDGDTSEAIACRVVPLESSEDFLANAWWLLTSSGSDVEWAAYNNECVSVEWQGNLYVDGVEADVEAVPWSEYEWETDPCNTGADGEVAYATSPY